MAKQKPTRRNKVATRQRPGQNHAVTQQKIEMSWSRSGPLPDPGELAAYEQLIPGMAERLLHEFEAQSQHRRGLEAQVVGSNVAAQKRGQHNALLLGLSGQVVAGVTAVAGHPTPAIAISLGDIALFAIVFIFARLSQKDERMKKSHDA